MKNFYLGVIFSKLIFFSYGHSDLHAQGSDAKVFGGEIDMTPNSPGSYSAVQVQAGAQSCTGTLVHRRLVITAAHCIENELDRVAEIGVNFVTYKTDVGGNREIKAVEAMIHPKYTSSRNFVGDIAWIKLSQDAFPDYRPIPVLTNPFHLVHGDQVTITGYGFYGVSNGRFLSDAKRTAVTTFNRYHTGPIYEEFFTTGPTDGIGPCFGDSGGPIYTKYGSQ